LGDWSCAWRSRAGGSQAGGGSRKRRWGRAGVGGGNCRQERGDEKVGDSNLTERERVESRSTATGLGGAEGEEGVGVSLLGVRTVGKSHKGLREKKGGPGGYGGGYAPGG
jgi:hypothetical protein